MSDKKLLSVTEVAERTGLSRTYIRTILKEGKLPYMESGKKYLISCDAIDSYIKSQMKNRAERKKDFSKLRDCLNDFKEELEKTICNDYTHCDGCVFETDLDGEPCCVLRKMYVLIDTLEEKRP